jgi:hypothetical protein
LREIFLRVIYHVIRTECARLIKIARAANGGDFRAERFGDLHRVGSYTTGGAVNQHFLSRLDVADVAQTMQGCDCWPAERLRLLQRTRLFGFSDQYFALAQVYSAKPPIPSSNVSPNTASPILNSVTFLPTLQQLPRRLRRECDISLSVS